MINIQRQEALYFEVSCAEAGLDGHVVCPPPLRDRNYHHIFMFEDMHHILSLGYCDVFIY